jgi:hypothetical protein
MSFQQFVALSLLLAAPGLAIALVILAGRGEGKVIERGYTSMKPGSWPTGHYISVQLGGRGNVVRVETDRNFDGYRIGDAFPGKRSA